MAKDDEKKEYELVEVPTQMGSVIRSPDGTDLGVNEVLVELLNKVDRIEESVVGRRK